MLSKLQMFWTQFASAVSCEEATTPQELANSIPSIPIAIKMSEMLRPQKATPKRYNRSS